MSLSSAFLFAIEKCKKRILQIKNKACHIHQTALQILIRRLKLLIDHKEAKLARAQEKKSTDPSRLRGGLGEISR
jgi:hypothetical protein